MDLASFAAQVIPFPSDRAYLVLSESYMYIYIYMCVHICMYACIYVYIYIYTYIHIYTYTYIHISQSYVATPVVQRPCDVIELCYHASCLYNNDVLGHSTTAFFLSRLTQMRLPGARTLSDAPGGVLGTGAPGVTGTS